MLNFPQGFDELSLLFLKKKKSYFLLSILTKAGPILNQIKIT